MTDVRRLVARLNPASPNLMGSGGAPEWTQQDIAAALAMLRDGQGEPLDELAREVFCACWAQDFARLSEARLMHLIGVKQFCQLMRQRYRLEELRVEVVSAQDAIETNGESEANVNELQYAKTRLAEHEQQSWSIRRPEMFGIVRRAVMDEVSKPNQCPSCKGRMSVWRGTLQVKCQKCEGRGTRPVSDRQRAAKIKRDEANYRREWRYLYEFTYRLVADAEASAITAFREALGMGADADIRAALAGGWPEDAAEDTAEAAAEPV
jgi:hypothetical protein